MASSILEAKQIMKETIKIYLSKDKEGRYRIPMKQQRPIEMLGPAGVGKTDAVKQVAEECNIGFIDCSITHHTRQSAIGLPVIVEKEGENGTYKTTEYTSGEIIGRVLDAVDKGYKEGILFLDEFNCASETLAPTMMQLLQKKEFGTHKLPEGWIIVVAGNPREYNKSAKELDMVTQDRLRKICVEQNFACWKAYMEEKGIHNLVLEFLVQHKKSFYVYEKNADGTEFVTPRGWTELSIMLTEYERNGFEITLSLIEQYIQSKKIAMQFYNFYVIYENILKSKDLTEILLGKNLEKYKKKYAGISLDKKWGLMSAIMQRTLLSAETLCETDEGVRKQYDILKKLKDWMEENKGRSMKEWFEETMTLEEMMQTGMDVFWQKASVEKEEEQWDKIKECFEEKKKVLKKEEDKFNSILTNVIVFIQETFGRGVELDMYMNQILYQKKCCIAAGKIKNEAFINLCKMYQNKELDIDKEITEELKAI